MEVRCNAGFSLRKDFSRDPVRQNATINIIHVEGSGAHETVGANPETKVPGVPKPGA